VSWPSWWGVCLLIVIVGVPALALYSIVRMASLDDRRWDVRDAYEEDDL
jgi:hypothetical protein